MDHKPGGSMDRQKYMARFRTPFYLPFVAFGPLALALMVFGSITASFSLLQAVVYIVLGLFTWTFAEYVLHRFPFHNPTTKEPWKFLSSGQHMLHHEIPNHPDYVAAPLMMSFVIYVVLISLVLLMTQNLAITLLWGSGFAVGYLVYEGSHYYAHHGKGQSGFLAYLKRYHLIHHFKDSNNYYGVTSPIWDMVFRTKPKYNPSNDTEILPIISRAKG